MAAINTGTIQNVSQEWDTCSPRSDKELFTSAEAAGYLDVSEGTLEVWRCTKRYRIPYIKIGRNVRYRKRDLEKFLDDHTVEG
jgi:excisionase family DNA binding protein